MMKINDIQKVYKRIVKARISFDNAVNYIANPKHVNNVVTITAMAKQIVKASRVVEKANKNAGTDIPSDAMVSLEKFAMWIWSNNINMNPDEADDENDAE